ASWSRLSRSQVGGVAGSAATDLVEAAGEVFEAGVDQYRHDSASVAHSRGERLRGDEVRPGCLSGKKSFVARECPCCGERILSGDCLYRSGRAEAHRRRQKADADPLEPMPAKRAAR